MERNGRKDIANGRTTQLNRKRKSQRYASMTITLKKKKLDQLESTVCSQIVLKCQYLARIGRLDILLSVSKLGRAGTKWTEACDKRLGSLISYTHHTCDYRHYCYVGNTAQTCRLGLFLDSDFAGDLEDSKKQH